MKTNSLGFIGGGRIAKIILQAFENSGITFGKIVVTDTNPDMLKSLMLKMKKSGNNIFSLRFGRFC